MTTLFMRLSLVFAGILLLLGLSVWWVTHRTSEEYFLEFTQQLNAPIAMYMAENAALMHTGAPDSDKLAELASHLMMVNPSVEVYLLDSSGKIIANSPLNSQIGLSAVSLEPINQFLKPERVLPIRGDDPKNPARPQIFSAFPLYADFEKPQTSDIDGYVYAVLAGERHQTLLESVSTSYSFKNLTGTLAGVLMLALLSGVLLFFTLTRRLHRLTNQVRTWRSNIQLPENPKFTPQTVRGRDEIDKLADAYHSMATQLLEQYAALERSATKRREFIANISHDLRTPLTTMQSYLETMILKEDSLTTAEKRDYTRIAYRRSKHLRKLVSQLFTLTKLESGEITPAIERFCLLELAHDSCQEFQIRAEQKNIDLYVEPAGGRGGEFTVEADIGMIHRVFENLLSNALRHTSTGGMVVVSVTRFGHDSVNIVFSDSGCGMTQTEQTNVMQRYYCGSHGANRMEGQTGLGLAIVRQILNLHSVRLRIRSEIDIGTEFSFSLPIVPTGSDIDYERNQSVQIAS